MQRRTIVDESGEEEPAIGRWRLSELLTALLRDEVCVVTPQVGGRPVFAVFVEGHERDAAMERAARMHPGSRPWLRKLFGARASRGRTQAWSWSGKLDAVASDPLS